MFRRIIALLIVSISLVFACHADEESDRQAQMVQLKRDYHDWYDKVKSFRRWYDEDTDKIREAICSEDESKIQEAVYSVANRIQTDLSSAYEGLANEADRLMDRGSNLQTGSTSDDAQKLRDNIQRVLRSIGRAKEGKFLGAESPKVRARIQYGIDKHKDMQSSCVAKEVPIESSYCSDDRKPGGCRIDCINVSSHTCVITEFKPKNDRAERAGNDQLERYQRGLQKKFSELKADGFKGTILEQCIEEDKLNLETKLDFYSFCPVSRDDVAEQLDSEVSE